VAVTIDLSDLAELTPEQISQLTGERLEKDEDGKSSMNFFSIRNKIMAWGGS